MCEKWLLRVRVFTGEHKIVILSNNDNSDIFYKYKNNFLIQGMSCF